MRSAAATAHRREPPGVDGFELRSCLARFATGVAVVAVDGPDCRHGLTVNSFTAVSLEPPLVLVALLKAARGHDFFLGRPFGVNILGAEHEALARHFAGRPQSSASSGTIVRPRRD